MIVINFLGTIITPILENIVTFVHRYRKNKRNSNYTHTSDCAKTINNIFLITNTEKSLTE